MHDLNWYMEVNVTMEILSGKEASKKYFNNHISYWKLLGLAKTNKIPHFWIGKRIFFRKDSLDEWVANLENNKEVPTEEYSVKPLRKMI